MSMFKKKDKAEISEEILSDMEAKGKVLKEKKDKLDKKIGKKGRLRLFIERSIARKIGFIFFVAIVVMAIITIILAAKAMNYNRQYSSALNNVYQVNYIMTETKLQANRFMSLCTKQTNVEESGEREVLQTMMDYLDDIQNNIGDDPAFTGNQSMLTSVRTQMDTYSEYANKIFEAGENGCFPSFNGDVSATIQQMYGVNTTLAGYCSSLLTMELERSSALKEEISASFTKMIVIILIVFIVATLGSIMLCIFMTLSITRPVSRLKKEIVAVADGDLTGDTLETLSEDEIKDLTESFNSMANNLRKIIKNVANVTVELGTSAKVVSESAEENEKASEGVVASLEDISSAMHNQTEESTKTMSQVGRMNEVTELIQTGINQINTNAENSMTQAEAGAENIRQYTEQLEEVNAVMAEAAEVAGKLTDSTKQMNQILKSITDISSQTRLLSLNASIEAARAGEAGRGFAVVATEIGNLANDTQVATAQITDIIKNVQQDVEAVTDKMNEGISQLEKSNEVAEVTKQSFVGIKDGTSQVSGSVQEILGSMETMAELVEGIVTNMKHMDESIERNTKSTVSISQSVTEQNANLEEVAASANALTQLTQDLEELISGFKLAEELTTAESERQEIEVSAEIIQDESAEESVENREAEEQ